MVHICCCLYDALSVHEDSAAFKHRVLTLATSLRRSLSIPVGSRVCLLGGTSSIWLETLMACLCNGWIGVPLNLRWSLKEMLRAVSIVSPVVLFFDAEAKDMSKGLTEVCDWSAISMEATEYHVYRHQPSKGSLEDDTPLQLIGNGDDAAVIIFTSGTTGEPKGVTLSHAALHFQALYKIAICDYSAVDVYLHAAPLFHVGGLISALAMTMVGARQVFMRKFEAKASAQCIATEGVTCFIAVPAMLMDLAQLKTRLLTVKKILVGGGAMNQRQAASVAEMCPNALVWTAYGMTEAASSLTYFGPLTPQQLLADSPAGYPIPGTSIAIDASSTPSSNRRTDSHRTDSEVLVKGPHLMCGYWNDASATEAAFTDDGYFKTGDVGCINSMGALILEGRLKEMIKSGGETIYPLEVTSVLLRHPAISDAVVVGMPHPRLGESLCAYVSLSHGFDWQPSHTPPTIFLGDRPMNATSVVTPYELQEFCFSQGLTRFKLPRLFVVQCAPLPRTSTGKHSITVISNIMRQLSRVPFSKL